MPRVIAFVVRLRCGRAALVLILTRTDLGKAIRAVAKEKHGAALVGIDVEHILRDDLRHRHGLPRGRRLPAAADLLCHAAVGYAFVLVAFTIVVLGGMGCFAGALVGGLLHRRRREPCAGLYLGESLGQIGIFVIFILVLLFRPTGLFGARA